MEQCLYDSSVTPNWVFSRTVTSLHGGDLGRFLALMNTEMANMNHMLTDPTGAGLLAHALGVQTGPCDFLAVMPAMAAGQTKIEGG
jgi:hypothetical protein